MTAFREALRSGLAVVFLLAIFPASCTARSVDALVGEYALKPEGRAEVKISRDGDQFVASVRQGSGWSRPESLVVCTEADYAQLFGPEWKQIEPFGLRATNGPFGIFRVKKGATAHGRTFETGYFLFALGGGDVYKL